MRRRIAPCIRLRFYFSLTPAHTERSSTDGRAFCRVDEHLGLNTTAIQNAGCGVWGILDPHADANVSRLITVLAHTNDPRRP